MASGDCSSDSLKSMISNYTAYSTKMNEILNNSIFFKVRNYYCMSEQSRIEAKSVKLDTMLLKMFIKYKQDAMTKCHVVDLLECSEVKVSSSEALSLNRTNIEDKENMTIRNLPNKASSIVFIMNKSHVLSNMVLQQNLEQISELKEQKTVYYDHNKEFAKLFVLLRLMVKYVNGMQYLDKMMLAAARKQLLFDNKMSQQYNFIKKFYSELECDKNNVVMNVLKKEASSNRFVSQSTITNNELFVNANYFFEDKNSIIDPYYQRLHPLNKCVTDYLIKSSENKLLYQSKNNWSCKIEGFLRSLLSNCRYIEITVHNGFGFCNVGHNKSTRLGYTGPIVYYDRPEKNLFTKLSRVLACVKKYAFVKTKAPLVISLKNHCNREQTKMIVGEVYSTLGAENIVCKNVFCDDLYTFSEKFILHGIIKDSHKNNNNNNILNENKVNEKLKTEKIILRRPDEDLFSFAYVQVVRNQVANKTMVSITPYKLHKSESNEGLKDENFKNLQKENKKVAEISAHPSFFGVMTRSAVEEVLLKYNKHLPHKIACYLIWCRLVQTQTRAKTHNSTAVLDSTTFSEANKETQVLFYLSAINNDLENEILHFRIKVSKKMNHFSLISTNIATTTIRSKTINNLIARYAKTGSTNIFGLRYNIDKDLNFDVLQSMLTFYDCNTTLLLDKVNQHDYMLFFMDQLSAEKFCLRYNLAKNEAEKSNMLAEITKNYPEGNVEVESEDNTSSRYTLSDEENIDNFSNIMSLSDHSFVSTNSLMTSRTGNNYFGNRKKSRLQVYYSLLALNTLKKDKKTNFLDDEDSNFVVTSEKHFVKCIKKHGHNEFFNRLNQVSKYKLVKCDTASSRTLSININPNPLWNNGVNIAPINMLKTDAFYYMNEALFSLNGGCGYIDKQWIFNPFVSPEKRNEQAYCASNNQPKQTKEMVFKEISIKILAVRVFGLKTNNMNRVQLNVSLTRKLNINVLDNDVSSHSFHIPQGEVIKDYQMFMEDDEAPYFSVNAPMDSVSFLAFELLRIDPNKTVTLGRAMIPTFSIRDGIRCIDMSSFDSGVEYLPRLLATVTFD